MEFHYKEHHSKLAAECPPSSYKPEESVAYRWVFDDINDGNNFISQFEKKPKRFNAKDDWKKCEAMSLSMYKDKESAIESFYFFKDEQCMNEKVFRILGTKIAEGALNKEDGVNERGRFGQIIVRGHFNHHPAKGYNYPKKFEIIASFVK